MFENWVIDATMQSMYDEVMLPGTFCFIPVEGEIGSGDEQFVVGMSFISDKPPHDGKVVGVIHEGGQEAVEKFCVDYAEHLKKFRIV